MIETDVIHIAYLFTGLGTLMMGLLMLFMFAIGYYLGSKQREN